MLRLFGHSIPSFGVCIRDGYEKQGYGEMMTEKTIQKAKEFGYTEVILTVHKENAPALELYKKIGFTTMYQDLKTSEIKMKKLLPSFSSSGTETLRRKKAVNI
jgi:ribosomal protein S18 acetylase RimI-like enzyme